VWTTESKSFDRSRQSKFTLWSLSNENTHWEIDCKRLVADNFTTRKPCSDGHKNCNVEDMA